MAIGIVGRKAGMTRVFTEGGVSVPVTVIQVEPNRVTQVRSPESDGYSAIQVTVGNKKASRLNKPAAGHFAKAGVEAGRGMWEFRLADGEGEDLAAGGETLHRRIRRGIPAVDTRLAAQLTPGRQGLAHAVFHLNNAAIAFAQIIIGWHFSPLSN